MDGTSGMVDMPDGFGDGESSNILLDDVCTIDRLAAWSAEPESHWNDSDIRKQPTESPRPEKAATRAVTAYRAPLRVYFAKHTERYVIETLIAPLDLQIRTEVSRSDPDLRFKGIFRGDS